MSRPWNGGRYIWCYLCPSYSIPSRFIWRYHCQFLHSMCDLLVNTSWISLGIMHQLTRVGNYALWWNKTYFNVLALNLLRITLILQYIPSYTMFFRQYSCMEWYTLIWLCLKTCTIVSFMVIWMYITVSVC